MMVKVVGVADIHGYFAERCKVPAEACLVLIAGDVTKDGDSREAVVDLNRQFADWAKKYPDAKFVMIAGNHDKFLQKHYAEMDLGSAATFLCDSGCTTVGGLKVYGTSWCPGHSQIFECAPGFRQMMFAKIPGGLDVLITHAPPMIAGNDKFQDKDMCMPELTDRIILMEDPPKVIVCGHLHPASGAEGDVVCKNGKKVRVYNVAKITKEIVI